MYRYDEFDHAFVRERVAQFRGHTLAGEQAEFVVKVGPSGRLYVITVYVDE